MALLIMLVPFANTNNNFSNSNVMGQAYGENYRSYYPTNDYKYECKKGPFEGFFVESVEFCDQKLPVKDPIEKKDKKVPVKDAIVNIEKKLFTCANIETTDPFVFECVTPHFNPVGPDSGEYEPCTADGCPFIDESEFAVQIFKDVVTVHDLTPDGTPVNLDKFHYTVTESQINNRIDFGASGGGFLRGFNNCFATGFSHGLFYEKEVGDQEVSYGICVKYVGDCNGIIYPGQVKTCTVENYIHTGVLADEPPFIAADGATTGTTTSQSNNEITTTTTQSSNAGVPQSSNAGVPQSSNAGVPNTFSSSPSSPLANLVPSNPN